MAIKPVDLKPKLDQVFSTKQVHAITNKISCLKPMMKN